jgi:hypothetical protein
MVAMCPQLTINRRRKDGRKTRFALQAALYPKRGAGPEQLRMKKATSDEMASALGLYVKRWQRWIKAGIGAWVTTSEPITYQRASANLGEDLTPTRVLLLYSPLRLV